MRNKLLFIEGLRGFAAMIVVFQHLVLLFYPTFYTGDFKTAHLSGSLEHFISVTPFNIFYNGNFAVCLFFVLSGFVLSYKYFKTKEDKVLYTYAIKRYFRLLLPVAFSVLFVLTLLYFLKPDLVKAEAYTGAGVWLKGLFSEKPQAGDVIYNIFIDVFWNSNNKYNPVLWTMGVEFLGSLILFALLFLSRGKKIVVPLFILSFVALCFFEKYFYAAFLGGSLICYFYVQNKDELKIPLWLKIILFMAGIYLASYPTSWQYYSESIYKPLTSIPFSVMDLSLITGSCLLFYLVVGTISAQKFFSKKLFEFLGKISFSNYLIHFVILICISLNIFLQLIPHFSYNISVLITVLITLPLIFGSSLLVQKYIDNSAIHFSNYLAQKFLALFEKREK
jgi:peptidoglycan/LPS O-acetylase OafA/YrhL